MANNAALAEIFGAFALAGQINARAHGALAATIADVTLAGRGDAPAHAVLAETLAGFGFTAAATTPPNAALHAILPQFALAGMVSPASKASLAATFGNFTLVGSGVASLATVGAVPGYAGLGPVDFEAAIAERLLPRGLAWTRLAGTVLQGFWRTIADALGAVHARSAALTERESFPPTSVELLSDWERVLGLPDPCLGVNPATSARQASVAARIAANGGQSVPYFEALAVSLGGTIEVTEYAPFRFGIDSFGEPLRAASWAYTWLVTLSGTSLFWFEFGASAWGEPFWQVPGGAIACEIQRLAPAHTLVLFGSSLSDTSGAFLFDYSLTDSSALIQ